MLTNAWQPLATWIMLGGLLLSHDLPVKADIHLDGSYGQAGALMGSDYQIHANLGKRQGTHLFHSFSQFNLNAGESATFSGDAAITRIFSRVTGGSASQLNGELRSTIVGADLYFFNPAGIVFGEHARLNILGSFYASTANDLQFADGTRWATGSTEPALLSAAPPTAFGFLDTTPASITKQHSVLAVPSGATLALIGGDIDLQDRATRFANGSQTSSFLAAPSGQLTLISTAGMVQVPHATAELQDWQLAQGGQLQLQDSNPDPLRGVGNLHSSGTGSGQILIRAGQLSIDNAHLYADSTGSQSGRGVNIQTSERIALTQGSRITAEALGTAAAGDIYLHTAELEVLDGSQIVSSTRTTAPAGDIHLTALNHATLAGQQLITLQGDNVPFSSGVFSDSVGTGAGGDIIFNAGLLTLREAAQIRAATWGNGAAGQLDIHATHLHIDSGAQISVATGINSAPETTANAGEMHINVTDSVVISGPSSGISSNSFNQGQGGTIRVNTAALQLRDQGALQAASSSQGAAGQLIITAQRLDMQDSEIVTLAPQAGGGDISLYAIKRIYLQDSRISAAAGGEHPTDDGGNLAVQQPAFMILANSELLATAFVGNGGDITLVTDHFIASNHSQVDASSQLGLAGQIFISAPDKQLDASLLALNSHLQDAIELVRQRCNPWQKAASRFYVLGHTGLPTHPAAVLEHSALHLAIPASRRTAAHHANNAPRAGLLAQCQAQRHSG